MSISTWRLGCVQNQALLSYFLSFHASCVRRGQFLDPILDFFGSVSDYQRRKHQKEGLKNLFYCVEIIFEAFTVVCGSNCSAFHANLEIIPAINQITKFSQLNDFQCKFVMRRPSAPHLKSREKRSELTQKQATKQSTQELLTLPFLRPTFHRGYVKPAKIFSFLVVADCALSCSLTI